MKLNFISWRTLRIRGKIQLSTARTPPTHLSGQRDERVEPISFKKVLEGFFPGKHAKAPNSAGTGAAVASFASPTQPSSGPTTGQEALPPRSAPGNGELGSGGGGGDQYGNAGKDKVGGKGIKGKGGGTGGKGKSSGKGGDKGGFEAVPWHELSDTHGTVVEVSGLGRINPFGGGVSWRDLRDAMAVHGPVLFVDMIEQVSEPSSPPPIKNALTPLRLHHPYSRGINENIFCLNMRT